MGATIPKVALTRDLLEDYATLTYLSKGEILYLYKKFQMIDAEKLAANYQHRFSKEEILAKFSVLRKVCSDLIYISQPTVCHIVERISRVLAGKLNKYVHFPRRQNLEMAKRDFSNLGATRNLPGLSEIVGAIDCTHIKINRPRGILHSEAYRNRHGWFSINVQNNPFQDRLFRVFSSQRDDCFSFEDMVDLCSAMSSECPAEVKAAWAFKIFDIDEDNQISDRDIGDIIDRLTWDEIDPSHSLDLKSKKKIADVILKEIKLDGSGSIGQHEFQIMLSRIPEFKTSFYFRL